MHPFIIEPISLSSSFIANKKIRKINVSIGSRVETASKTIDLLVLVFISIFSRKKF